MGNESIHKCEGCALRDKRIAELVKELHLGCGAANALKANASDLSAMLFGMAVDMNNAKAEMEKPKPITLGDMLDGFEELRRGKV